MKLKPVDDAIRKPVTLEHSLRVSFDVENFYAPTVSKLSNNINPHRVERERATASTA
jgi:hypothetical protein